jgi:hypothetical protein
MLSKTLRGTCAAVALSCLAMASAQAADRPGAGCTNFTFNAEFLKAYPRAPAACQEVVTRDGVKVVRFSAEVRKAAKDHFQIAFLNAVGRPLDSTTLTLIPQAGQTVEVNGKSIPIADLRRGDKLDFWVPENSAGAFLDRNSKALNTIVLP